MRQKNDLTFLNKCLSRRGSRSVEKLVAKQSENEFLQGKTSASRSMDTEGARDWTDLSDR